MKYRWGEDSDIPEISGLLDSVRGDKRDLIANQFMVATDNGKIVGCVRLIEKQSLIELVSLGVLPEYRGKHIGSMLVSKLLKLKTKRPVYLLCFGTLISFYNRMGFVPIEPGLLPLNLKGEFDRINAKLSHQRKDIIAMKLA